MGEKGGGHRKEIELFVEVVLHELQQVRGQQKQADGQDGQGYSQHAHRTAALGQKNSDMSVWLHSFSSPREQSSAGPQSKVADRVSEMQLRIAIAF